MKYKFVNADARAFIEHAKCSTEVDSIARSIVDFSGQPTEDEILSRCCMVFEGILHEAMSSAKDITDEDLQNLCVEIQKEK